MGISFRACKSFVRLRAVDQNREWPCWRPAWPPGVRQRYQNPYSLRFSLARFKLEPLLCWRAARGTAARLTETIRLQTFRV